MLFIYKNYYNIFTSISLYNMTESICNSIISFDDDETINNNNIPYNKFEYFKNLIEIPLINIKNSKRRIAKKRNSKKYKCYNKNFKADIFY